MTDPHTLGWILVGGGCVLAGLVAAGFLWAFSRR
jgi:hypothetical protein